MCFDERLFQVLEEKGAAGTSKRVRERGESKIEHE
jgi:hypothetical protein